MSIVLFLIIIHVCIIIVQNNFQKISEDDRKQLKDVI